MKTEKQKAATRRWIERNREKYLAQKRAHYREKAAEISAAKKAARAIDPSKENAANLQWEERHPGRKQELGRLRYAKDPEAARAKRKRWYARNAAKDNAAASAYAKRHAARINAKNRARYAGDPAHRLRVNAYNADRQRFGRSGTLTPAQWTEVWESYRGLCAYCPAPATSMDHVVPRKAGGKHETENVVPACRSCNSSKKTRPLLRFLLKRGILSEAA